MRTDDYPTPISAPEALGLPETADDDSTAYDDVDTGREADGPDPAQLPLDRDDRPLAVDQFGNNTKKAREGESLDPKLGRERPDPALKETGDRPDSRPSPIAAESFDPYAVGEEVDAVDRDTALDEAPVEPNLDSPVSMYGTGIGGRSGTVGRLVGPGQGGGEGTE